MARSTIELVFVKDRLTGLSQRARSRVGTAVKKIAFDVTADAKQRAPVDTGALRNSIGPPEHPEPFVWEIPVGVEYAAFVEFGTVHQGPQPYLTPALEKIRPVFDRIIGKAIDEAALGLSGGEE